MWVPEKPNVSPHCQAKWLLLRVLFRDLHCIIAATHVCTIGDSALQGLHDDSSTAAEMQDTFDSSAVMEQEGKRDSLGCISIFQAPPKRFIRTIKPVAGSSFNVRSIFISGGASQCLSPAITRTPSCERCMPCILEHVQC